MGARTGYRPDPRVERGYPAGAGATSAAFRTANYATAVCGGHWPLQTHPLPVPVHAALGGVEDPDDRQADLSAGPAGRLAVDALDEMLDFRLERFARRQRRGEHVPVAVVHLHPV